MTGSEIRRVRCSFDLSPGQFAELLGVSPSSVYRWEAATNAVIEPFQLKLLAVMSRGPVAGVKEDLVVGGGLRGLYRLLGSVFGATVSR